MDLIERYIAEVGRHLPAKNRSDIQAELRSSLVDSLEARAGENPSEDDIAQMLKEFGAPRKVAASYWPEGQYLIGPRLYPLFEMITGIVLTVLVIVQLVLFGITAVFNPENLRPLEFLATFASSVISAFGSVVLVFAVLQRLDVRPETEEEAQAWDPNDLPAPAEVTTINRSGIFAETVFTLIFVAIFAFLPQIIDLLSASGLQIYFSPVFLEYIPLLILATVLGVGLDIILLWRGRWETPTRLAKIGLNIFGIYILGVLINAHTAWLAAHGATGFLSFRETFPPGQVFDPDAMQIFVMQIFRMAFIIALIVSVVETVRLGYQLVQDLARRGTSQNLPPHSTASNGPAA